MRNINALHTEQQVQNTKAIFAVVAGTNSSSVWQQRHALEHTLKTQLKKLSIAEHPDNNLGCQFFYSV